MPTETEQAQLLADWLDQPPGTPPPAGLDADVVASVYALRPDRAPVARVTIDDVLARVTAGPLVESAPAGEVVSLGAVRERAAANEAARSVSRDDRPGRRVQRAWQRWWVGPAVGLGLAAAAALLLVVPTATRYASPTARQLSEDVPVAPAMAPALPAAPPPSGGAPSLDAAGVVAEAPAETREKDEGLGIVGGLEAEREPPTTIPEAADPSPSAGDKGDDGWSSGGEAKKGQDVEEASTDEDDSLARSSREESAPAKSEAEPAPVVTVAQAPPPEPAAARPASAPRATTGTTTATTKSSGSKAKSAEAPSMAAPSSSASAPADVAASSAAGAGGSAVGDGRRSSAAPQDYDPTWYRARTDVASAFAAAAATDGNGAIALYATFYADSDRRVAQEALFRAAKVEAAAGRLDAARALVDRGLAAYAKNVPTRSMLQVLRGDLLAAGGDSAGAAAAYAEAARLNAMR